MVGKSETLLITCEHGGNRVPPRYDHLFVGWKRRLDTHRGLDFGALEMAEAIAAAFHAPLVASTVSRLLVDLNRSIGHPDMLSTASRRASLEDQRAMVADHYRPYRDRVERLVADAVGRGHRVVHVSSHSFTPRLYGEVRRADVGLLYDPARSGEVAICQRWKSAFARVAPELVVRRNYPYAGKNDGLTSALRKRHAPDAYVGVELEINQALVRPETAAWQKLRSVVIQTLRRALDHVETRARAPRKSSIHEGA